MHNRIKVYPCQAELWSYPVLNCWGLTIQWGLSSYHPELRQQTPLFFYLKDSRFSLIYGIPLRCWLSPGTRNASSPALHIFTQAPSHFFPMLRQRPSHSTFTKTQDYKSFFSNWISSGFEQQLCCNQWYSRQSFCFCVILCHMHRFVCTHLLSCLLPGHSGACAELTVAHCACTATLFQGLCYEVPQSKPSLL